MVALILLLACGGGGAGEQLWNVTEIGSDPRQEYLLPVGVTAYEADMCGFDPRLEVEVCQRRNTNFILLDDLLCTDETYPVNGQCFLVGRSDVWWRIYWL